MVQALNQFICGLSLKTGVYIILACTLIQNLFYVATAAVGITEKVGVTGFTISLAVQTFNSAFCMLGVPFIVAAFWGVANNSEPHVKIYLAYSVLAFILDMIYIGIWVAIQDTCTALPMVLERHGSAFACGFTRAVSLGFIAFITVLEMYCIFTTWSLCEDFKEGGVGSGLSVLHPSGDSKGLSRRQPSLGAYSDSYGENFASKTYGSVPLIGQGRRPVPAESRALGTSGAYYETSFPAVA